MPAHDTTSTPTKPTLDPKVEFTQARNMNSLVNEYERTNGHSILTSRPLRLGFDISSVCNAKCIFCLADSGRRKQSDPDAFRSPDWMDNFTPLLPFIELGIFSSFEAMMNPNFDQFVERLHIFHTPFQVFTNGKLLSPDMNQFMLAHGLGSVHCSFHSPDPTMHEEIMRGVSHTHVVNNLKDLTAQARKYNPNFKLVLVFCAMRRNIRQLLDYVDLAREVGATNIQVNYLLVTSKKMELENESMFFHQGLYDDYVQAARLKASKLGIVLMHQPLFGTPPAQLSNEPCFKPWQNINVNHNGNVNICCGGASKLGNIFKQDFFEVWNSKPFRAFRKTVNSANPPAACRKCTRGKENPKVITTHITYLRGLSEEDRRANIQELMAEFSQ